MWISGEGVGVFRRFLEAFDDCDQGMRKAVAGWLGEDLADLLDLRRRLQLMVGLGLWTPEQKDVWWRCLALRMDILVRGQEYPLAEIVEAARHLRELTKTRAPSGAGSADDPAPTPA